MPTNTWEPPPRQSDTDNGPHSRSDEPRNFETASSEHAGNYDASAASEGSYGEHDDINMHGSER